MDFASFLHHKWEGMKHYPREHHMNQAPCGTVLMLINERALQMEKLQGSNQQ